MRRHTLLVCARTIIALASACAVFSLFVPRGRGEGPSHELREFSITVDGKPAGNYRMEITAKENGTWQMTGAAAIKVRKSLVYNYTYNYNGTEMWRDDHLEALDSTTDDDGKKYSVRAQRDVPNGRLQVAVNGQQQAVRGDVWTTTYWRLPSFQTNEVPLAVPLLDCDTGKPMMGNLQYLDRQKTTVLNTTNEYLHYRLTGGDNGALNMELWYDGSGRLVRQETMEDGHRVVLTLTAYSR